MALEGESKAEEMRRRFSGGKERADIVMSGEVSVGR